MELIQLPTRSALPTAFGASAFAAAVLIGALSGGAAASIVSHTNFDDWSTATATPITSIFFTEIDFAPSGPTVVNDQYSALGVHFADHFLAESYEFYPSDGRGLAASLEFIGQITVDFTVPRTSVGVDHKGPIRLDLFLGDEFLGSSIFAWPPSPGVGFLGVASEVPFDRVVVIDPAGSVPYLDNLHFGAPIPAPSGLALLGLGLAGSWRRRRDR